MSAPTVLAPSARGRGAIYTPPALVAFTLARTFERLREADAHGPWLDPACGDGAFLSAMVARIAAVTPRTDLAARVREHVVGIDVDPDACVLARRRIHAAVETITGPQEAGTFDGTVRCADFLRDPVPDQRFSVIVGNPPYVSATQLDGLEKPELAKRFETAWGRMDLYGLFFEQALRLLAPGGTLGFLTPDKFLTAQSSRPLRSHIAQRFVVGSVSRFERHDLFPGVATVPAVTVIQRPAPDAVVEHPGDQRWWDVDEGGRPQPCGEVERLRIAEDGAAWTTRPRATGHRPAENLVPLGSMVTRISAGLATGLNRCFVLTQRVADEAQLEPEILRAAVRGRDIRAGHIETNAELRLIFPYDTRGLERPQLIDLEAFPKLAAWLMAHRAALANRHCVRRWNKAWWDLHDPVTSDLARRPKILLPDLAKSSRFAFDPGTVVPLHSAYYVELLPGVDPEALVGVLNSPAIEKLLLERAPIAKSGYRRFRAQFLRDLPVPQLSQPAQSRLFDEGPQALDERLTWALHRHAA